MRDSSHALALAQNKDRQRKRLNDCVGACANSHTRINQVPQHRKRAEFSSCGPSHKGRGRNGRTALLWQCTLRDTNCERTDTNVSVSWCTSWGGVLYACTFFVTTSLWQGVRAVSMLAFTKLKSLACEICVVNTCACPFVHNLYSCLCICKSHLGSKPEASFQCSCTDRIVTYHWTTLHGWYRCTPAPMQGWLPILILLMHPSPSHLPGTRVSVSKSHERVRDDDRGFQ